MNQAARSTKKKTEYFEIGDDAFINMPSLRPGQTDVIPCKVQAIHKEKRFANDQHAKVSGVDCVYRTGDGRLDVIKVHPLILSKQAS